MATELFQRILTNFPRKHMRLVFAYGSGVFQQQGHKDMSKNMIDFIFVVDNSIAWHTENLARNGSHYSFLKYISGPKAISLIQEKLGAHVYFNTLVPCEDRIVKYGVISTNDFRDDLLDWDTLYISGRLHKPVNIVYENNIAELTPDLHTNLASAVHTSLLMLPESFSEEQLFCTITGLSYSGDFRMKVGEDKNKIANIVRPNMERFRALYGTILDIDEHLHWNKSLGRFEQSLGNVSQYHHLNLLPKLVQNGLVNHRNRDGNFRDVEDVLFGLAHDSECSDLVSQAVSNIVKRSSITQSLKGIFTAGLSKSVKYSWSKLKKMWKSKNKQK